MIAEIARRNAGSNGFTEIAIQTADLTVLALPPADHAFANPPYYCSPGTVPSDRDRCLAKHAATGVITAWIRALAAPLRRRGTLTIVLPPAVIPEALEALEASKCAAACMFPLWPGSGRAAKLILLQGVRDGRGKLRLDPGLTLHSADGGFTPEANSVLRDNATLELTGHGAPHSPLRETASPPSRFDQGLKEATTTGSPR